MIEFLFISIQKNCAMSLFDTNTLASIQSTSIYVEWRSDFFGKLRGLMGTRELDPNFGIVLAESKSGVLNTSIHMLFVYTPLAVFWLDENFYVVHKTVAKPWDLAHASPLPAKYVLELHSDHIGRWQLGDTITFNEDR